MHVYPTIAVAVEVEVEISTYTDEIIIIDSENIENIENAHICINITSDIDTDISDTIDTNVLVDTIVLVDVIGDGDQTNYCIYCMNFCEYIIVLIIIGIIGTSWVYS